jgi:hypothetical protein
MQEISAAAVIDRVDGILAKLPSRPNASASQLGRR